jgi:ABC-type transporter Mla subunit MlaD
MPPIPDPRALVGDLLGLLPRVTTLLGDVEALVARIERTRQSADDLVARIGTTVDRVEQPVETLQPVLERLAETTEPHEVDALISVIDQLPEISAIITTMSTVAPDLHELLRVSTELNEMLAKVPFLNRRD